MPAAPSGDAPPDPNLCACGCGKPWTRLVHLIPEKDREAAVSMRWSVLVIALLRQAFFVAEPREEHIPRGFFDPLREGITKE